MALITDGLVANWDMANYTSGTAWTDSVSSKTITLSSSASKTADGIEFSSSRTFSSASLSSLSLSYPCTLEWQGRIDSSCFSDSAPANIFGFSNSDGGWAGICCYSKSSNGIQLDIGSSGTVKSSISGAGTYHIVVTISSNGITTLYVNDASSSFAQSSANTQSKCNKTYLYNTEGSNRFVGAISSIRLWNKALSSDELEELFTEEGKHTISVTSNYSTYFGSLSNIIDGSTSTYWWAGDAQQTGKYVQFRFSKAVTLKSASFVTSSNTGDCIKSCNVLQISSNGSDWSNVGTFTGSTSCSFNNINKIDIKYVRIYASSSVSNWLCISEATFDYSLPAPIITVISADKAKISDELNMNECICYFTADVDLSEWEARATLEGASKGRGIGLLVESGTNLTAGENGLVSVLDTELTDGDGDYVISIYGKSSDGEWSE